MPLYVDGKQKGAEVTRQVVEVVDISERIAAAVRENGGRLGDLSRYTASEMKIILETIAEMAKEATIRISAYGWLDGIDIEKVVDMCETVSEGDYEMDS